MSSNDLAQRPWNCWNVIDQTLERSAAAVRTAVRP